MYVQINVWLSQATVMTKSPFYKRFLLIIIDFYAKKKEYVIVCIIIFIKNPKKMY